MLYLVLKALHVVGVVLFLGNVITGFFWKLHADRGDLRAREQALDGLIRSDRIFTTPAVLLIIATGVALALLAHIPFLARAAEVVLHHHEAYDGSGYPKGLAAEAIPLSARIFAVADTLDALTSDRPYRRARPLSEALAEIQRCSGSQFDPRIVDALLAIPTDDLLTHVAAAQGVVRLPGRPWPVAKVVRDQVGVYSYRPAGG